MRELDGSSPGGPTASPSPRADSGTSAPGSTLFARLALPLVSGGTAFSGAGYLAALLPGEAPPWAAHALALGIGALLVGILLAGARRQGRVSTPAGWLFLATGMWVAGGLMILLTLPGLDARDAPLLLGLPRRAAFLLLGVGLAPGLVVPLAYGLLFDRETLSEADLERLREAARRVRNRRAEASADQGGP